MDRRFQERIVGALVLVGAAVLILPAVLRGPRAPEPPVPAEPAGETQTRTQTIELEPPAPRNPEPVAEPPAPPSEASSAPAQQAQAEPAPGEPATSEPPPASVPAKPAQEAVQAPPRSAPGAETPARVATTEGGWAVQVGNFSSKANAVALAAKLEDAGFAAFVMPHSSGGKTSYRVRVGPEVSVEAARAVEKRLEARGNPADVVRHP